MRARRLRPAGFTLVEMAVVTGIVAVLAALSLVAIGGWKARSEWASSGNDLVARLKEARTKAFGHGAPTVFVLQRSTGRYWLLLDPNADFQLTSFDPANPAPAPDTLLGAFELTPSSIGPAGGYGTALPTPWAWVPAADPCTLCGTGDFGAIVFRDDGAAEVSGPLREGASFTIYAPGRPRRTIAVASLTGSIESFEKLP